MTGVTATFVKKRLLPEMAANWESLEEHPNPDIDDQIRNRFLGVWDQHRRVYGYTLLAELPDLLRRALEAHADLEGLEYDLLVVDEYQDLNACDLRVLRLLADRGTSILGVGDDEQSIYSFRKAAPDGIRRFPADYENAEDYALTISHRCGSDIIAWARHVIEGEPERDPERPRLEPASTAPAGECALLSFRSAQSEARGVASLVEHLIEDEGLDPSEIIVLFRGDYNNTFSSPIKEHLEEGGTPVFDPSWVDDVMNDHENRVVVLLLRLLASRDDSLAWAGLMSLTRGIGRAFMEAIYRRAIDEQKTFAEALLTAYERDFAEAPTASREVARTRVEECLAWIDRQDLPEELEDGCWGAWIVEAFNDDPPAAISQELGDLLLDVDELMEEGLPLGRYMGLVQPLAKDRAQAQSDGVRFMSMSMSKGLTVTASIVVGAEDGVIPRSNGDLSEERRLMYVAMTRARGYQFVTWANRRIGPTARAGTTQVQGRRYESRYLRNGPVRTQDGESFIGQRWAG